MPNDQQQSTPNQEHATSEAPVTPPKGDTALMGILAYIGPLVIIPYLTAKGDPFVKFHIKQGLVLFVIELVLWVIASMFWFLLPFVPLLQLAVFILSVVGIVNVVHKKEKPLPLVGSYAEHFKI